MQRRINLILNGKGGVGKSFFATNFVQYLKDQKIGHTSIDTDNENSTLKRFHPDANFINIAKPQEIDSIFSELKNSRLVIVDCRAASTDIFLDYVAELSDLLEAFDARLTIVSPVNHEPDSVKQIKIVTEALRQDCDYVIVKNQAHSETFSIYDDSKTRQQLLNSLQCREIVMPKLYEWLVTALNRVDLTITQAIQHPEFTLMDRQRLKNWQRRFYDQLELARDILLPQEKAATPHES